MRWFSLSLTIMMTVVSGCAGRPSAPPPPPVVTTERPASPQTPPALPKPGIRAVEKDLELVGLENASWVVWSPSGRLAVIQAKSGSYVLDAAAPSLTPLSDFAPSRPPAFWSDHEVLWTEDGRLQVRDLASGKDRLLHDFGSPVIQALRPGDTHFVANRQRGLPQQGHQFGTIITGALVNPEETVLTETGYLIGRMRAGQVLAVAGSDPGGPLWSITPEGGKRLVSDVPAHFVQISSDGRRALWLTGPSGISALPVVAGGDGPYDPPLTNLWTWDGASAPVRTPLGGTFSVRAEFSPDGSRIALSLNEEFLGSKTAPKPGRLVVLEGGKLRSIATFNGWVGLGMWLGADGFRFMPPAREKTGGQAPIMRMDLTGKQEQFGSGLWNQAGLWDQTGTLGFKALVLNWKGDVTTVHWSDSTEFAQVRFDPNQHLGNLLYARPSDPYLPFSGSDRLWLMRLER